LKDTNQGASVTAAGREFQAGMVLGKKTITLVGVCPGTELTKAAAMVGSGSLGCGGEVVVSSDVFQVASLMLYLYTKKRNAHQQT
jgi:hypothetical protein